MERGSLALGMIAALGLSASPAAQTHPSFSGKWIPSIDVAAPNGAPVLGPEVKITQDATAVALEVTVLAWSTASGRTSQTQRLVYKLDGSDSPQDVRTDERSGRPEQDDGDVDCRIRGSRTMEQRPARHRHARDVEVLLS